MPDPPISDVRTVANAKSRVQQFVRDYGWVASYFAGMTALLGFWLGDWEFALKATTAFGAVFLIFVLAFAWPEQKNPFKRVIGSAAFVLLAIGVIWALYDSGVLEALFFLVLMLLTILVLVGN